MVPTSTMKPFYGSVWTRNGTLVNGDRTEVMDETMEEIGKSKEMLNFFFTVMGVG